ncbi:MAG TPA: VWA domain-containing protein [Acidobacteriaceae bacterium]|nr:VWA domain-containing protein [Acidobacteriaceae bacterium]
MTWWATLAMRAVLAMCVVMTAGVWAQAAAQPQATSQPQAQARPNQPAAQSQGQVPAVDSDPVPSPDPDTHTALPPPTGPPKPGEITKEHGEYTMRANAYEVRLNASVIDASGAPVQNLPQDAFHVYEDGVPQTIIGFRHEDVPVSMGILIDSSGSMYDKRAAVDAASLDLVRLSNREDEAFLVDFSSEAYIDQDFTNSIEKLQQGLAYIKSSGGTALYDAVIASADYLSKNAKRSKQVLLIVTDGDDNASSATLEQTIRRVQDLDGPAIYCIGLLFGEDVSHSEARHSREVLTELATQTGGIAYFPKSLKEVDGITREVAQDIRSQYTIEYRSTKPPELGGYRTIHVEAKEKGYRGLQVRTRSGYFPKVAGAGGTKAGTTGD